MNQKSISRGRFDGSVRFRPGVLGAAVVRGDWGIIARRPHIIDPKNGRQMDHILAEPDWRQIVERFALRIDREELFRDRFQNLVVNTGLDYLLDSGLSAGTQITSWFLLLMDGTPTVAAGDTMASHAGWAEVTAYDEAARQAWSDGGVSGQSVDNSGSPAQFTISTNGTTIGGAGLTSSSTKGGSTGTLYAGGAFSAGDKSLDDNDTLDVTATFTQADDGA